MKAFKEQTKQTLERLGTNPQVGLTRRRSKN